MADCVNDSSRAPVAFGRRAVPQLFEELQQPETDRRLRALTSLCDLMHNPQHIYQAVNRGLLEQLKVLLRDENPHVRIKTCELLHVLTGHHVGRQALVFCSFLPPLSQLLDDSLYSCRRNIHKVLNRLTLLPAGTHALLTLVPRLMVKLGEEEVEEEAQVLLLSTLASCSWMDPLPALASGGVSLLVNKLSHSSSDIRREAAAAMMALSVSEDGKQQVCEEAVLPVVVALLRDEDVEVQVNAAGVVMYAAILTAGKRRCLDLDVVSILLDLVATKGEEEEERKPLVLYSLRALTSLAEAPDGRRLLLERRPLLVAVSDDAKLDQDVRRVAQTLAATRRGHGRQKLTRRRQNSIYSIEGEDFLHKHKKLSEPKQLK